MGLVSTIISENTKDKSLSHYCRQTDFGFFFPDTSLLLSVLARLGEVQWTVTVMLGHAATLT
jgi:hypothetical protein